MTDKNLIDEFTRVRRHEDRIAIQVKWVSWPHPHEPKSHWHTVVNLKVTADEASLQMARERLIRNGRYFDVCSECNERQPVGWMLDENICQSCGESNHGIVF